MTGSTSMPGCGDLVTRTGFTIRTSQVINMTRTIPQIVSKVFPTA